DSKPETRNKVRVIENNDIMLTQKDKSIAEDVQKDPKPLIRRLFPDDLDDQDSKTEIKNDNSSYFLPGFSLSTIKRTLSRWGLKWGRLEKRDYRRLTNENISKRQTFLKSLKKIEVENPKIVKVYLDESYVHENDCLSAGWYIPNQSKE